MKWKHRMISVSALYITTFVYFVTRSQNSGKLSSSDSLSTHDCIEPLTEIQKLEVVTEPSVKEVAPFEVFERKEFGPGMFKTSTIV